MTGPRPTPASTYRVQVTAELDLPAVARLVPYLHRLGVDWVYLSPLLAAEPGSAHGYDVVAHDCIDDSRGGPAGLAAVAEAARDHGMGVLVDVVPNHVGVATPHHDPWWWDLLMNGRDSVHAAAFDVDWAAGGGRIRIPVLGDDDQDDADGPIRNLTVVDGDHGPELRYHDRRFPVAPGSRHEGDTADQVHARQHYQLVNWRTADTGLNYRRFFAVNELAAVRVEDRDVFEQTHVEIRRWFDEGLVDGLRVDHPDGLRHPGAYLQDLAGLTGGAYVLVEKILGLDHHPEALAAGTLVERLPDDWATAGTTGYDALALIDRVLTDPAGQEPLTALDARLRGRPAGPLGDRWDAMVHDSKRTVADGILNAEVRRIVRDLPPSPVGDEPSDLVDAVAELLACFPVYRSYLPYGVEHLDAAFAASRERRPDLGAALDPLDGPLHDPVGRAALRFQQTSGMVMAKGVEDSAFYRWSALTSLTEVGGEPAVFTLSPAEFHAAMSVRQREQPEAMTALSTHDTKRGEDVRARIAVLAELPSLWERSLTRLLELAPLPDPGFGNLLWQAVVGCWPPLPDPDLRSRLHGYAEKAMREAGDRTTWTTPDAEYEEAVHAAVDAAFDGPEVHAIVEDLVETLAGPGWSNALAAKLLCITVPGVPDVYQGSELWEQSLVDPDNRRPVDFDARAAALDALPTDGAVPLSSRSDDTGTAKLQLTATALRLRRDRPELFTGYTPLAAQGTAASHVLAFDRGGAVTVVTRLPFGLAAGGGWGDTALPLAGRFSDAVSGRTYDGAAPLAELMADQPAVLLVEEDR